MKRVVALALLFIAGCARAASAPLEATPRPGYSRDTPRTPPLTVTPSVPPMALPSASPTPHASEPDGIRRIVEPGLTGVELDHVVIDDVVAGTPPSPLHPWGTLLLAVFADDGEALIDWDPALGTAVRSTDWPCVTNDPVGSLGIAKSGEGWVLVSAPRDLEYLDLPTRICRTNSDFSRVEWSRTAAAGVYPSVSADGATLALSACSAHAIVLTTFDAQSGAQLAARSFSYSGRGPALRPLIDVVIEHGFVYTIAPGKPSPRVVRLSPRLRPTGIKPQPVPVAALADFDGDFPRLVATADGLLVASVGHPGNLRRLDTDLVELQRGKLELESDDSIVVDATGGFVTSAGLTATERVFSWSRPPHWQPLSDTGIFERRRVVHAFGRIFLVVTCCGRSAILYANGMGR